MNNWFQVKVKFTKEFQDGTLKRVTEPYLINAMSFTEAEARIYKEVGEFVRGEFSVNAIIKIDYADIFHFDDAEVWYKAKVSYVSEDADSGKEKRISNNYLVSAHNVKEAYERVEDSLKGLMITWETPVITKTDLVEIFPYEPSDVVTETVESGEVGNSPNINVAYAAGEEE